MFVAGLTGIVSMHTPVYVPIFMRTYINECVRTIHMDTYIPMQELTIARGVKIFSRRKERERERERER